MLNAKITSLNNSLVPIDQQILMFLLSTQFMLQPPSVIKNHTIFIVVL